jgi:hypothetical protein
MQVSSDVTAVTPILKERAQRRDHDLGPLRMSQARCLGLHEANDVRRSEPTELNFSVAEEALEKTPHRLSVQTNRRRGEPTIAQKILLELLSDPASWRYRRRVPGHLVVSIGDTESGELMKRKGVAASAATLQPSLIEVAGYVGRRDAAVLDAALIEPGHEVRH